MKLRGEKLKSLMGERGVSLEQLATALGESGRSPSAAESALRNWMIGRDYPRCRAADIRAMCAALDCEPADLARFTSIVRLHRGSPRKAKLLADLIRGKSVDTALNLLTFTPKRAAVNIRSALSAAIADAEQADADVGRLFVSEIRVDNGPHIKRFQPKDRGRAHPILKRTSHITVGVEEREE